MIGTLISLIIWLLVVGILYFMQRLHINKGDRPDLIRSLGNVLAGIGIVLCIMVAPWIIFYVHLRTQARNITTDATSIYVSRSNLLLNWTSVIPVNGVPGQGITGNIGSKPSDSVICFTPGYAVADDPTAFDQYRAYIKSFEKGSPPVDQYFEKPDGTYGQFGIAIGDQEKLSLAYYRYLYCTKTYFEMIIQNKATKDQLQFLSTATYGNLMGTDRKSNCGLGAIRDTSYCAGGEAPPCSGGGVNPCFTALNETIAAQCLLYDDTVYGKLNATAPQGVLGSFELGQGFMVHPPPKPT